MNEIEYMNNQIQSNFPYSTFRDHQQKAIQDVIESFDSGNEVIIIDAPTGFGKSAVNYCLGSLYSPTYYTTPLNTLIDQLANEFEEKGVFQCLKSRSKYICNHTGKRSNECGIYLKEDEDTSCQKKNCTYHQVMTEVLESRTALVTFSMLIVHPKMEPRNLLIIDECQSLEGQVASFHAGITINKKKFENNRKDNNYWNILKSQIPKPFEKQKYFILNDEQDFFDLMVRTFQEYHTQLCEMFKMSYRSDSYIGKKIKSIEQDLEKFNFIRNDFSRNTWLVTINENKNHEISLEFKPEIIGNFLKEKLWVKANQYILSSATIPFRNDIDKFLMMIGLEDKPYSFHKVPMTFPVENRPINTSFLGEKMTAQLKNANWDGNVELLTKIIEKEGIKKGVIHAVSYYDASRLRNSLYGYDVFVHDPLFNESNKEKVSVVEKWVDSEKQILISPTITEGVDLKDDLCRWQVLWRVPWAYLGDGRVHYKNIIKKDRDWYVEEACRTIVQMYGRAIRSIDDYATFYIIDPGFNNLVRYNKKKFPEWFLEAIDYNNVEIKMPWD